MMSATYPQKSHTENDIKQRGKGRKHSQTEFLKTVWMEFSKNSIVSDLKILLHVEERPKCDEKLHFKNKNTHVCVDKG